MPPFTYAPPTPRFAATIAEMIRGAGDIRAREAESIGQQQAQATQASGQAWATAAQNITQAATSIPGQVMQARQQQDAARARAQQTEMQGIQLENAKRQQSGQRAVAGIMQGDTLQPGDVGPRQDSFLDANGLFDVKRITQRLGQLGYGDQSADLVRGAESINDSILKHQEYTAKATQQKTILLGDLADGVSKLTKVGMPFEQAIDFVGAPTLATKQFTPEEFAQTKAQLVALPPEQQQQALATLMDAAAKLGGQKSLGEGSVEVDRYGRTAASNPKAAPRPTAASIALDAAGGDPLKANDLLHPKPTVRRTDKEQDLDAFAKTLGKTQAEELTHEERMAFDRNEAAIRSSATFQQHVNEHNYDNAHPTPEKPKKQDDLEQEYRTILARGLSSRSGGLGLEDTKVQTANHLMALIDQSYDAKTGNYNIPKVMQSELALGLARLISPNGTVGVQLMEELNQATAAGDMNKAITYLTGKPQNGSTQDVVRMFKDSIDRQGKVAEDNRENEMRYLRGLAPTSLDEARRKALEANQLGALRQSRTATDAKGNRRLWVSTDGGATWK